MGSYILGLKQFTGAFFGIIGAWASIVVLTDGALVGAALAQTQSVQPLSANDVSWLFPAPTRAEDFANLISMQDLTVPNAQDATKRDPVWSSAAFQAFLSIAGSPEAQVAGTPNRIGLPIEAQSIAAWHIAGVRIDAGAPGLSTDVLTQFGQRPQIRLIIQPVTRNADGTPVVRDIAGHLIFDFTTGFQPGPQPTCSLRPVPDLVGFKAIVAELDDLRTKLSEGGFGSSHVTTAGMPLGVHPGLKDPTTASNVSKEMKAFLERHLSAGRLSAMAIMALPAGASDPWIFLSMVNLPPGILPSLPDGGFVPVRGPTLDGSQFAQLLNPVGDPQRVVPLPHTNNLNPITCLNAALPNPGPPLSDRSGSSTADVFGSPAPSPDKIRDILDLIADPGRSHFFNTDCVSCHTETRQTMELLHVTNIPGIDTAVLPNGPWNVRNFGWSPPIEGPVQSTATRRAANETAAVVNYINTVLIAK
jgi:hypothetical protein